MQLYGHRRFVVEAKEVEEDSVVETISGDIPVKKGEFLLRDMDGNVFPLTETRFKEYYVPVERVKEKRPTKKPSPFEEAYARQLAEFAGLESQTESDEYIQGTKELVQNKMF